jgi:hypothetical protein
MTAIETEFHRVNVSDFYFTFAKVCGDAFEPLVRRDVTGVAKTRLPVTGCVQDVPLEIRGIKVEGNFVVIEGEEYEVTYFPAPSK